MFRKIVNSMLNLSLLVALIPILAGGKSITDQVFAELSVSQVRGTRVNIWTAVQPSGWYAIAGLTGLCTGGPPCSGTAGFFETGYIKGTITPVDNVLQQYVSFANVNGSPGGFFGLGNLSNNTWYTFQTLYSNTAQRWEAWRNGQLIYFLPFSLNFTSGGTVACGAEGGGTGVPLGVECKNMRYKLTGSTQWVQYNYNYVQHTLGYCAGKPYEYGAIVWGPNCE